MSYPVSAARSKGSHTPGNGLLTGLLTYFPMNEASGDIVDLHSGLTLAAINAPSANSGLVYPTARELTRASERGFSSDCPTLEAMHTAITFAWWEYPTAYTGVSGQYNYIWGQGGYATGGFHVIHTHNGGIVLYLHDNTGPSAQWSCHTLETPTLNAWNFSAFTYDSATNIWSYRLNTRPALGGNDWVTGTWKATTANPTVGKALIGTLTHSFDGRLGPIAIWNRALSPDEITAFYNAGAGLAYAQLTA